MRVDRSPDHDRLLEILEPAAVAGDDPRDADRIEVTRARGLEAERLRQLERLRGELDRPLEVVRHHQDPPELLEHERLRRRWPPLVDQLTGALEMFQRPVALAPVQPDTREPGLGLGRSLDLPRAEQALGRIREHRVVESDVVDAAPRVGEEQLGTLLVVPRPELERCLVEAAPRPETRRARGPGRPRPAPPARAPYEPAGSSRPAARLSRSASR